MAEKIFEKDVRDAFFDRIYELASKDENLVFITADAGAFSLKRFKEDFPDRFINVGVAEQTMVLLATGLAMCGKNVFIYSIIPFITQRALEHIKVNVCSMNLPVTIVGCGAGISFGFDGPTHHGNQDIAAMKSMPDMKILSPSDAVSSMLSADEAYKSNTPAYVRLDKGRFDQIYDEKDSISTGAKNIISSNEYNIISTGFMTPRAVKVSKMLSDAGYNVGVTDITTIKPLNKEVLCDVITRSKSVFVIEEHSVVGGLASSVSDFITDNNLSVLFHRIGLPDKQIFEYGDREWILDLYSLSEEKIYNTICDSIVRENKIGGVF